MATLEWSDALALDMVAMDATHQEFVDLLAQVNAADDAALPTAWQALVAHTDAHFAQEDRWMVSTGFAADNCHSLQHRVVLQIMRDGAERGAKGELHVIRGMASELVTWFTHHAQTMDAALAQHMGSVGFDPATGAVSNAQALPEGLISGCGGACSKQDDHEQHAAQVDKVAQQAQAVSAAGSA